MKLNPYGKTKVDLSEWCLPDMEKRLIDIQEVVKAAASEALQHAFETAADWNIYFPAEWGDTDGRGGPPPIDPMTLVVEVPLGGDEFDGPEFACSLREVVAEIIENNTDGDGGIGGEKYRAAMRRLADGFNGLGAMLEEALALPHKD